MGTILVAEIRTVRRKMRMKIIDVGSILFPVHACIHVWAYII